MVLIAAISFGLVFEGFCPLLTGAEFQNYQNTILSETTTINNDDVDMMDVDCKVRTFEGRFQKTRQLINNQYE